MSNQDQIERHEFSAEVGRLLDLVVHALYSDREIFLRELVANAADATDRRRFEALTDAALTGPEGASVAIRPDAVARTLTIEDAGVGMSKTELTENLGTIARSGTRSFGAAAQGDDKPSLIGQFGVGFYAAFMVASRVTVTSRRAGTDEAWQWESDGTGAFTLAPAERAAAGTTIVLHMKEDAAEFLEPLRLQTIIRKWADHITVPVTVEKDGTPQPANEGTALWRKRRAEVTAEQYTAFYHRLGHPFDEPWATLHWQAEGTNEFAALLFIPTMPPFGPVDGPRESRVRLHVRRMFITDEAALLPPWARFVVGVVDTEDLPLNVSREMLQATPVLTRVRKAVTARLMAELKSRAAGDDFDTFWQAFGATVKEGVWEDHEHRQALAGLMRFRSSADPSGAEGWVTLDAYVARMKPEQEAIYFLVGDDADALAGSTQVEGFRARGVEVLLMTDQVDAFWPERLGAWDGKPLRSVSQGAADLSKMTAEAPAGEAADLTTLLPALKAALGDAVADVRTTDRLVDSAVVLAAAMAGPDLQMQRLMRRANRDSFALPPTLEVNPRHPLLHALAARAAAGEDVTEAAQTLLDLARVQDGDLPADPAAFARRVTAALTR